MLPLLYQKSRILLRCYIGKLNSKLEELHVSRKTIAKALAAAGGMALVGFPLVNRLFFITASLPF